MEIRIEVFFEAIPEDLIFRDSGTYLVPVTACDGCGRIIADWVAPSRISLDKDYFYTSVEDRGLSYFDIRSPWYLPGYFYNSKFDKEDYQLHQEFCFDCIDAYRALAGRMIKNRVL